jgi:hypothetical protein
MDDILSPDSFNGLLLLVSTLGLAIVLGVIGLISRIGAAVAWGARGRLVAKAAFIPAAANLVLGLPVFYLFVFDRDVLRGNGDFDWGNLVALPWLLLNALWVWHRAQSDEE